MGCPLRVQVGALYGSRAWQWPLQQAPLVVGLLLPVRALARRVSEGSGLDRIETRPVELIMVCVCGGDVRCIWLGMPEGK